MDISVYSLKSTSDQDIDDLLKNRKSFVLEDIARTNMSEAVETLEEKIESLGLR